MIWEVADLESLILPNPVPLANIFCARLGKSASLGSLPQAGKARPAAPVENGVFCWMTSHTACRS